MERTSGSFEILQNTDQPQTAEENQFNIENATEERRTARENKLKKYEEQAKLDQQFQKVILETLTLVLARLDDMERGRQRHFRFMSCMLKMMALSVGTTEAMNLAEECLQDLD